ncbi:uncharacterized protein LOC133531165 [Cydia pomonella]|uniref:uncharacterized protein LOC133531165 n=1 Tax=Cydia pomonella TaxID=82600 RepID=UPI002ADE3673|nr:uncharacterized protein LOC133531165 [Cydia pomonella]
MALNPLNELKRRLEDKTIVLPKRLCLARNVIHSPHFPAGPKERVVAEWLDGITKQNGLSGGELRNILGWISIGDDLSGDLKTTLIQIVSDYVKNSTLTLEDIHSILNFLENEKLAKQVTENIDENLFVSIALLRLLRNTVIKDVNKVNILTTRILTHLTKHYKESKKKLEFIIKLLDGENLETIFSLLDTENRNLVIELCQNILFPMNKKTFFISFLQTLVRKDNIDELIAEKGDNIQSVLKIMNTFFEFPKGRTSKDFNFLCNFVDVFVSCFKGEHQLIFALYIITTSSLNMTQKYLNPNMILSSIVFEENDDKIKRNIFLKFLDILLKNEVDISVRLTDTFGEKISKVEIKKNFTGFLQSIMMGLLKLEGKPDKTTMNIINVALQLDPILIEQKLDTILPPIMAAKKNNSSTMETYTSMVKCLLHTLFKLSRGTLFITQILPNVKLILEACNPEQFELIQKSKEDDSEKIKSKIITSNDIIPQECVEMYGRWTSELMFRQNSELLVTLHKDFQVHCLMMLEEGYVSPSIITLAEVLAAILCSFFENSKMADHTVPRHIAEEFWNTFGNFENECLKKLGECVLKLNYNPNLANAFLKLCVSFSRLKLINLKYGNIKVDMQAGNTSAVIDFSPILPCLKTKQWVTLAGKVQEEDSRLQLDHLVANKILAVELLKTNPNIKTESEIEDKSHLIKQLTSSDCLKDDSYFNKIVMTNIERGHAKQLAKYLVKLYLSNIEIDIFKRSSVINNRPLLNALVLETLKNISKCLENADELTKALSKSEFDLTLFLKDIDVKEYFNKLSVTEESEVAGYLEILKQLQIYYLEEKYQLAAIFLMLAVKKSVSKKLKRNIDHILQSIYELTPKNPDLYKIFPVNFLFSFTTLDSREDSQQDITLIELMTLKIKTSNNLLLIKSTLETGVKKVKTDSEIVKSIVKILLKKQKSKNNSTEYFCDPVFQISCIILPIIAKEKRAITTSAYRSILADLQEKIHKTMLDAFKKIDFSETRSFSQDTGNIEDSVVSDNIMAALNAMEAYSLTLSKYCETNDAAESKNLDFLWSGLNFFIENAIQAIQNPDSKAPHIESSIHLLNVSLRYMKKLETHDIFKDKDGLFLKIWRSIKNRLLMAYDKTQKKRISDSCLEHISTSLKFVLELSSIECFTKQFVGDLGSLATLKDLQSLKDETTANTVLTSHKVSKYLTTQCLKANITGPKCAALSKQTYNTCKTLRSWLKDNYEYGLEVKGERIVVEEKEVIVGDVVCDVLRSGLEVLSEIVLGARRIILDYKFLDSIFELLHQIHGILCCNKRVRCTVAWPAFFTLYDGSTAVLNSLLVSREEILEDRWPCYMQCYRALVFSLCERSSSQVKLDKATEDRLAEAAHSIEKLTQSICKRKTHISRLATYTVADISSWLERTAPCKMVRQHLENSVVLFIQASDSTHAMAFLRRALAGSPGQMTMTNLYTMYKRYHKYTGNA